MLSMLMPSEPASLRTFSLAVNGGAGVMRREATTRYTEAEYRTGLSVALMAGHAVLAASGSAVESVTRTVMALEDDPLFNAGRGAVFTSAGKMEMDAATMDGRTRAAGAVAGLLGPRNPILAARAVMERSGAVMLIGEGALAFCREQGIPLLDAHLPIVEARWRDGRRNATALHREVQEQGFAGGYDIIRRWVARRRRGEPSRPRSVRIPSTRRITRWLTAYPAALSAEEGRFIEALIAAAPGLRAAAEQVRAFASCCAGAILPGSLHGSPMPP